MGPCHGGKAASNRLAKLNIIQAAGGVDPSTVSYKTTAKLQNTNSVFGRVLYRRAQERQATTWPGERLLRASFFYFLLVWQSRKRVAEPHPCWVGCITAVSSNFYFMWKRNFCGFFKKVLQWHNNTIQSTLIDLLLSYCPWVKKRHMNKSAYPESNSVQSSRS